jgi:hypothetical protein
MAPNSSHSGIGCPIPEFYLIQTRDTIWLSYYPIPEWNIQIEKNDTMAHSCVNNFLAVWFAHGEKNYTHGFFS